jgi:hypothetical protein
VTVLAVVSITLNFGLLVLLMLAYKERKELLDRVMAQDLIEYRQAGNTALPRGRNTILANLKQHEETLKRYEEGG